MDWFETLTGFREDGYEPTRAKLKIEGTELLSLVNGRRCAIGSLELPSLAELRARVGGDRGPGGRVKVRNASGDIRAFHLFREHEGALFQVASQFNMLEMVGPSVTPEHGVTRYEHDRTQGPACAISAGAATLYRNYFAPVGDQVGQTKDRQLDGLVDLGPALVQLTHKRLSSLWSMRNGYALVTPDGLAALTKALDGADEGERDRLRGLLRIGLHQDIEVTEPHAWGQTVSQAFCSAMPVAYGEGRWEDWRAIATLVLEAAYEATLWAAVLNARRGASNIVLLTRLGGGAFGNDDQWIDGAMQRALDLVAGYDLEVLLVSHGAPPASMLALAARYG
ncbi:hypothetical protein GVN21_03290 [Caulobacter sp. SLTY]|uniref:hypothetical protein n=1 Tax=Caulobacter sp. SLTY TaxID=2683262 RepID=UPI0014124EEB|nr:hypothetical protein [Caulobacter sp. SLTY]NBB14380.1 hypothetical protein [Caulobacter sp. SLTY]